MKLIKIGLLVNVLLAASFVFLFFGLPYLTQLDAAARYTELDRAAVINQDALKAYDPALAQESRHLVPGWLTETAAKHERYIAGLGFIATLANGIAMAFLGTGFKRLSRRPDVQRSGTAPTP